MKFWVQTFRSLTYSVCGHAGRAHGLQRKNPDPCPSSVDSEQRDGAAHCHFTSIILVDVAFLRFPWRAERAPSASHNHSGQNDPQRAIASEIVLCAQCSAPRLHKVLCASFSALEERSIVVLSIFCQAPLLHWIPNVTQLNKSDGSKEASSMNGMGCRFHRCQALANRPSGKS